MDLKSSGTTPLRKPYYVASRSCPSPCHLHLSTDLFLICILSVLQLPHSCLYFISPNWLSSEVVTSLNTINATYVDFNLFLPLFYKDHQQNNPLQFFLSQYQPPISILYIFYNSPPFLLLISFQKEPQQWVSG